MKNIQFEAFEESRTRFGQEPRISIFKSGGIRFNKAFIREYLPKKKKFVALRFGSDKDYMYIGFSFLDDSIQGALKLSYYGEKNGAIQCVSFFKKYEIDYKNKYKGGYKVMDYDDNNLGKMWVIELKK